MEFLEEVKKELRPKDTTLVKVDNFISKINKVIQNKDIKAKCVKGGSTAKGTFLKGDFDVDLFVVFEEKYRKKDISKILGGILKQFKPKKVHGSRDYYQLKKGRLNYEIVPVLDADDILDVQNITDMSPLHVGWVNSKLNDKLRDEIRLAKKFCKAQKVYGAESYINGFSGHVLDILVIYYKGFLPLLKAASRWKPKVIIDVEKKLSDPLKQIDPSKTKGPMIVVDPVQKDRNAAAALSDEKFEKFKESAKEFLKQPSKAFFIERQFKLKEIKNIKKDNVFLQLKIKAFDGKTDIVGAKLLKIYLHLKKQLELNNFTVVRSDWKWNKKKDAKAYFLVKEEILGETFVKTGPPLKEALDCIAFKKKNNDVFEKNQRLYANAKRRYSKPKDLIKYLIRSEYIKNKARKINVK
ncbi:CCA tRNA nucleotidyltransferase [Candidatus Woesearchaeota archaeon]|nr:CCA tRNA nucleotidyltransferase [Candidatus Woesearchaeota archaeon]